MRVLFGGEFTGELEVFLHPQMTERSSIVYKSLESLLLFQETQEVFYLLYKEILEVNYSLKRSSIIYRRFDGHVWYQVLPQGSKKHTFNTSGFISILN